AYIDITTSEFGVTQLPLDKVAGELERLAPAELLVAQGSEAPAELSGVATPAEAAWFDVERARERLLEHFHVATLEGYGCQHLPWAIAAAGAVLAYLAETQPGALAQVTRLFTYSTDAWMYLDPQTRRNLELFHHARSGGAERSLLAVLDLTRTAMGGRLLRHWFERPLVRLEALTQRLDAVEWFHRAAIARSQVVRLLGRMPDLERLLNRVRGGYAAPRDLLGLRQGLELVPELRGVLEKSLVQDTSSWPSERLHTCADVSDLLALAIRDDPPVALDQGEVIKTGFSPELDTLRELCSHAREGLLGIERKERERTGIKSLKVGFNKIFGYYFEVSNTHRRLVPYDYLRKQTLVGAERFATAELKELESTLLHAQEQMAELERDLFRQVCAQVSASAEQVLDLARALAELDCHAALAEAAARYGYTRPEIDEGESIHIEGGRHPVVERFLEDASFVPNDTLLSNHDCQIALITGPNMSGKSTYLRQVALITLMAQIGSFVPAARARIGLVDRIFTRVGAQDDLATGQSTFMVEMAETANILHHATARSLVVLDEIGRGTSTYDGISIAQGVVEQLHNHAPVAAKTLFATHYHELTALSSYLPRVRNFTFAVTEERGQVVFLRRILPGSADKSYGIHVARLAGMPEAVVRRAEAVLQELEQGESRPRAQQPSPLSQPSAIQLPLFDGYRELQQDLTSLDLDAMTPLEAMTKLYQLQEMARRQPAPREPA
ncbi:MAG TPA: DNA mismatch repair protein MutS, partial [Dehalococcoidia bacterium]|nr:DNA mismatch repair protein MutS [Dehalococcoidia bacterium]